MMTSHTHHSFHTLEIVILLCSSSITKSLTNFFAESFPQKLRQRDLELHITFSKCISKEICSLNLTEIHQELGQLWRQKFSSNQQLFLGFCGDGNLKLKLKEHCKQAQTSCM
jgi:hypothetical protein